MKITKKQIKELHQSGDVSKLKEWFPSVFGKIGLELGFWYKFTTGTLGYFQGENINTYGVHSDGEEWLNDCSWFTTDLIRTRHLVKATHQEIETALINEARKRGFINGVRFKSALNTYIDKCNGNFNFNLIENELYSNGTCVFSNGTWATIIPPKQMTQEEIENELGYKIEIV